MATNAPSAQQLLEALQTFLLEKISPQVDAHSAYHCKVAANVLRIVGREISLGGSHSESESARLTTLLKKSGSMDFLNAELCHDIRNGNFTLEDEQLKSHLWATTLEKLAIDNPRYSTYQKIIKTQKEVL